MSAPLILALPSKGRLKDPAEAWLADSGLALRQGGGARGYLATLTGLDGVEVRLISAGEIAAALASGEAHLGVTGEDLLREMIGDPPERILLLQALGFGRADLVVATPRSWVDVETMADLEEVAHLFLARTGRRLRVATKYPNLTRAFFARQGVVDYRIVESGGATEGAPAAGAAELICDITTTGATLAANGLKPTSDGLILASQAQLAASLAAPWDELRLGAARSLALILEARARALKTATLSWPPEADAGARKALRPLIASGAQLRPLGLMIDAERLFEATLALAERGLGPVAVTHPAYVFEPASAPMAQLEARVQRLEAAGPSSPRRRARTAKAAIVRASGE